MFLFLTLFSFVAADPDTCTLPDVVFTEADMTTENNNGIITAIFDKDNVSVTLRNVTTSQIGKLEFKEGIFTADPVAIDSATIRVPHCSLNPVVIRPKLYIKETGEDFSLAEPYCRNETTGDCFNLVKVTSDYYEYNVEHFTDYYVSSSGGDYTNLKDCLDAINNTNGNSCVITESGYFAISGAYGYNITPLYYSGVIGAGADNMTIDCNNSFLIGSNTGIGIFTSQTNTTIINCHFRSFEKGISYFNAGLGLVEGCSGNNNSIGIMMWIGSNIDIKDSNFTNSSDFNIKLDSATENISIINVDARYSGSVNLWAHTTAASNITVINSKFGNSSSETCVALVQSSAFINNTVENCLANDKAGLIIGTGSIVKGNLFYNNNVHLYLHNNQNVNIENNIFNKSNEADFSGFGVGFCLGLIDNSNDSSIINNTFDGCLDTGIAMGEINNGGNLNNNNITRNIFINTIQSSFSKDIYIHSADVENTSIWLNHLYAYGVNDSGLNTDFCVENEGNFYKEGITVPAEDCGPLNITVPNGEYYSNSINIAWTRQSSIHAIDYQLYYSNDSGVSWNHIANTSALNYLWNTSNLTMGLHYIKIMPNDGSYNGTNMNNTFYAEALPDFTARELLGRPTNTSIVINLINGESNISIYVEYGNESAEPGEYMYNTSMINATNSSLIEFNLTNLSPNLTYYYRVRAKETDEEQYGSSDERRFRTRRASYPFNFTILADAHIKPGETAKSERFRSILENMTKNDNSDFALHLGDNIDVYLGNETEVTARYKLFRDDVAPVRHPIPLFYVIGNWEGENGWYDDSVITTNRNIRKKYIPNPLNDTYPENGSEHEDYYAFTWGNALFVVLNVMSYNPIDPFKYDCGGEKWTLGSDQLEWLNSTLKAHNDSRDVDWKFIFAHHPDGGNATNASNPTSTFASPCYPYGEYGRGGGMAANVSEQATVHDMMKKYSVQAFFYGHDHLFVNISVDGIQYIGVGDPNPGGFAGAYIGYTLFNNSGRARVEVISNETAQVIFINITEDVIFNLTLNSTI